MIIKPHIIVLTFYYSSYSSIYCIQSTSRTRNKREEKVLRAQLLFCFVVVNKFHTLSTTHMHTQTTNNNNNNNNAAEKRQEQKKKCRKYTGKYKCRTKLRAALCVCVCLSLYTSTENNLKPNEC